MAGIYNFTLEQGSTFRRTLTWKDSNNTAVNLTGATAKMQLKRSDGTLILELTSGNGLTLGGSAGTITIVIPAGTSTAEDFDTARYDLELTLSNADTKRLLSGVVTLNSEVTV